MKIEWFWETDADGARKEILDVVQRNIYNNVIYFGGWYGFGTTAVLRSIAQALPSMKAPPPNLCFGRTIYIDCSTWKSKRVMQRKIAEELKLGRKTMAMFDEQDEEDDFNGVDHGSRDVIRVVAVMIDQTLRESSFMMIIINGSDDEIALGRFGIPENHNCKIIWTFSGRFLTMKGSNHSQMEKIRYTDIFLGSYYAGSLPSDKFRALFREEAASIVARCPCLQNIDLTIVEDCCLYGLLLYHSFRSTTGFVWPAHAPNYWICDGIIQQDRAREISNALHPEISFEECDAFVLDGVFRNLKEDPKTPFLVVRDDDDVVYGEKRPYRWIYVTLKNKKVHESMQTTLARASSIFLAFEIKDSPGGLPCSLFKQCSNLGVLVLSCCAFSFVSPPFAHCHTLRFLGLEHCTDGNTAELLEGAGGCTTTTNWACLKSLWVIDLHYTDWVEILSEEKLELMANLMELNTEGVRCSQLTRKLQKRLPNLERLRIVKPMHEAETSSTADMSSDPLFEGKTNLEILDLSGNKYMKNLPASTSKASHLRVLILDGCDGLESVGVRNSKLPSSLRSFSFDGYGLATASRRASTVELPPKSCRPPVADTKEEDHVVISKAYMIISLEGCTQLDNLFLRGLPNLVELDLSGCAIKVLDFGTMVVDVPRLRQLFLLGCEHLCAIKWGPHERQAELLELLCIDTRPTGRCARRPSLGAQGTPFQLQVHAIITDARLIRSLWAPCSRDNVYFNINITSSSTIMPGGGLVQRPEATARRSKEEMIDVTCSNQQRQYYDHAVVAAGQLYGDVFTKVIGDGPSPPMQEAFPQPPTQQSSDHHIEIDGGNHSVQSEAEPDHGSGLRSLMIHCTRSLHVHDVSTSGTTTPAGSWYSLRWCRVERCANLHAVFPLGSTDVDGHLETIWASELLMARHIWSKGSRGTLDASFRNLKHLHLRSCPSLRFALLVWWPPCLPSLETLHIIHCGALRHIFVSEENKDEQTISSVVVEFPKLSTIHLHDLPALRQICEATTRVLAPALETIRIRGCWSLRRLPALSLNKRPAPAVEVEKDVWDALEWDGVQAGHHPSLFQAPVHSRYYRKRMLRGTVLR